MTTSRRKVIKIKLRSGAPQQAGNFQIGACLRYVDLPDGARSDVPNLLLSRENHATGRALKNSFCQCHQHDHAPQPVRLQIFSFVFTEFMFH
jgi:hypothetical protein